MSSEQPQKHLAGGVAEQASGSGQSGTFAEAPTLGSQSPPNFEITGKPPEVPGYAILAELGRGGMGVVYKARHVGLNRIVALKMMLAGQYAGPKDLARFRVEAEAAARLGHPGIVQIYNIGELDGSPYLTLEYIDGGNLACRLNGQPIDALEAAQLIEQVARAVDHAHRQGIVHRDLKPANILLCAGQPAADAEGETLSCSAIPKITDFGLAKSLEGDQVRTQSGTILGTPGYMSPEQAAGKHSHVGPATDIYSLGAVLYELLTGQPPFQAATSLDTLLRVLSEDPISPRRLNPAVPKDLETICLKCLEKEPGRRYCTAADLADDLERFRRGEAISARPLGLFDLVSRWARRRPALAVTYAALAILYVNHLALLSIYEDERGLFHWAVTGVCAFWAAGATVFHILLGRAALHNAAAVAWAAMEVLLFSLILFIADGPRSPLIVGYLLLVSGVGLRFRKRIVWFTAALSAMGYVGLVLDASARRHHLQVTVRQGVVFVLSLLLMALVTHLHLRRGRPEAREV